MIEYILGLLALLELYKSVYIFIFKKRSKKPVKIMKGSSSFFWKRGKKVALMIHGFTSSPSEFRRLAYLLAKNKISAYAPLLPGHGTSPERLAITKYSEWVEYIEEKIKMLEEEYDEIYLVGNSFGGNLAIVSANKSKKIKGIITLGTPIKFKHERKARYLFLPILKRIKIFQKKRFRQTKDKNVNLDDGRYNFVPLRSIGQMLKVVDLSKDELKKIKVPVLAMQTENDILISPESADYILDHVKSKKKKKFTVPESYHVFILDKYAALANNEILKFIKKGE